MSSDDDFDLLNYTPLQRSQISSVPKRVRHSKLSLSQRRSYSQASPSTSHKGVTKPAKKTTPNKPKKSTEIEKKPVKKRTPVKKSNDIDQTQSITPTPSKRKKRTPKNTPVKSRADKPPDDCTPAERARWYFLFGSSATLERKLQTLETNNNVGGTSKDAQTSTIAQKRKSDSQDDVQPNGTKKLNGDICSRCKFPFSSAELKAAHSDKCESRDLSLCSKCPEGAQCRSTDDVHYWLYRHTEEPGKATGESSKALIKTKPLHFLLEMEHNDNANTNSSFSNVHDPSYSRAHNDNANTNSSFSDFRGLSYSRAPTEDNVVCESPDIVQVSDHEGSEDHQSMPLFDLANMDLEGEGDRDTPGHSSTVTDGHQSKTPVDQMRRNSIDQRSRDSVNSTRNCIDETWRAANDHGRIAVGQTRRNSSDCVSGASVSQAKRSSITETRRDSGASKSTTQSDILDLPLIPDIDLVEDEDATVYFETDKASKKSSIFSDDEEEEKQEEEENKPSSETPQQGNESCGSVTPDLENLETEKNVAGDLDDSEGDEVIGSVVEEALTKIAVPAIEKVLKWRRESKEALTADFQEDIKENNPNPTSQEVRNPTSRILNEKHPPVMCLHLHFHEASPAPGSSSVRENGQTSILQYFETSKPQEEKCSCSKNKTATKEESIVAWKSLLGRGQRRELVPIPTITDSSSQDLLSECTSNSYRQKAPVKLCPFYKKIPDTRFVVDAFNFGDIEGVTGYFLSHFHYDHYIGLKKSFNHPIYCSEITARLVNKKLGVPLKYLNALPMWEPQRVDGVEVTLLDANHCPGSVMFLFKVKSGATHLHVGDFRAHPTMESYRALHCPINTLFLDTTYCSPEYDFPSQEEIVEKCVSLAWQHHQDNDKTLFVVGSYTIGKERVFKAIAENLNCSIWAKSNKKQILRLIDDEEITARLTEKERSARVHVLPMSDIKGWKLKEYLNPLRPTFTEIVGLCPTGWQFTGAPKSEDSDQFNVQHPFPDVWIYGIPYSEHSSFSELRKFVQFTKPKKIIPTVNNGKEAARKKMESHFREWVTRRQLFQ